MTVKFIQYFDILPGQEEEFRAFASRNYMPGIHETGFLRVVGSWYVAAGVGPYHIMEGVADSVKSVNKLLQMDDFKKLNHLFHFLITNYRSKIIVPTGHVESEIPGETNFRFNQHYDVIYDKYDEYHGFMKDEYLTALGKLGLTIIGGWYVAIGPGPNTIIEGSCPSVKQILEGIGSNEYRELTARLLTLVTGFGSKILVPTGLA